MGRKGPRVTGASQPGLGGYRASGNIHRWPEYSGAMGQIIVEQVISADGYAADKAGGIGFFEQDSTLSEMNADQLEMLEGVDAMVFGANTYRMFREFWPTPASANEPVANFINTRPKHVVSSTLSSAPWGSFAPAQIEKGDAMETLKRLRHQYSGHIIIWGSLTLAEAALRARVADRLRLRSVPVLIGSGRSATPDDLEDTRLTLLTAKSYPNGHVLQDYQIV
ncbi:MAG: dihydrofolate reductase family protein [Phycisphaerae bacterium]|nr:dihydrofolate reductase family protein [Gemmatimonadaceae bacterium]